MAYYSYHGTIKRLLAEGKLEAWYYTDRHNHISPALVLVFNDAKHPKMPLREYRWAEYLPLLPPEKEVQPKRAQTETHMR